MDVPTREYLRNLLLELVPADGAPVSNARLLESLRGRAALASVSLSDADYAQVRDALVREGRLIKGKGRGGTVGRSPATATPVPEPTALPEPDGGHHAYQYDVQAVQRPDVGVQDTFAQRRPPRRYRYDSSLAPELLWDENPGREQAERLLAELEATLARARAAAAADPQVQAATGETFGQLEQTLERLRHLSRPFLNWAGKAERQQITVPTVPLFVHERLSTQAILGSLEHYRSVGTSLDLFGDPELDVADKLDAYTHKGPWTNRMILGDSLQVMNSLLEYEGLGAQVQMIYFDPPYGVKFGSNFQPFVRKRDVKHGADEEMAREPEMVRAYRDTWELGLHSYLTYLRDRLLMAREMLADTGSIFVQISDENLHHVRELMDEVFGAENYIGTISFKKTTGQTSKYLASTCDYLSWYAKKKTSVKFVRLFQKRQSQDDQTYSFIETPAGDRRRLTKDELADPSLIENGSRIFRFQTIQSPRQGRASGPGSAMHFAVKINNKKYYPTGTQGWKTTEPGITNLIRANRIAIQGKSLSYIRYFDGRSQVQSATGLNFKAIPGCLL